MTCYVPPQRQRSRRHHIFISYAREDEELALGLCHVIRGEGLSVWWDRELRWGENFPRSILSAINGTHGVVCLWSKASAASEWVRREATIAAEQNKLMLLRLDRCRVPGNFPTTTTCASRLSPTACPTCMKPWALNPTTAGLTSITTPLVRRDRNAAVLRPCQPYESPNAHQPKRKEHAHIAPDRTPCRGDGRGSGLDEWAGQDFVRSPQFGYKGYLYRL